MAGSSYHNPVLLHDVIKYLEIKPDGIYVDGTLGGGGHSEEILKSLTTGKLLGFDVDDEALEFAGKKLASFGEKFVPVKSNFSKIQEMLYRLDIEQVDGILLDLGVSSRQLDSSEKGFTFRENAPLDLRLGKDLTMTGADVVNTYGEQQLTDIFRKYGEEKYAYPIAREIITARSQKRIRGTSELCDIIDRVIFEPNRKKSYARIFQAIRIEVNQELQVLEETLKKSLSVLGNGGRLVVISYHSLEDRIVKEFIKYETLTCICPPRQPICTCGKNVTLKNITRKAIEASDAEQKENPRSRSAKLRVAERINK